MAIQLAPSNLRGTPLERLVDDYLANCQARGLSPRTIEQCYGYSLHHVFLPWCSSEGIADLAQLNGRAVDRFNASLLARRAPNGELVSKHTVHHHIRPVRQLLTWADRIGEPVVAKPQLPKCPKPFHDILSREEIDRMERAAPTERDKLIVRILADCGLRLHELVALTPAKIVRSSGRQTFLRVLGKGARLRDVPIPPVLLRRLERYVDGAPAERASDQIFLTLRRTPNGEFHGITDSGARQTIRDAGKRAGLSKRVHPHLLRHSWMTEMLRRGMNPIQLSIIAGASQQVIADHYTWLTKDDAYDAMIKALTPNRR